MGNPLPKHCICPGADLRMVRIGTGPPFWQINHANSAYFRLFLGYFQVLSATRPPFLHILDPPLYLPTFPPNNFKCVKIWQFQRKIGKKQQYLFFANFSLFPHPLRISLAPTNLMLVPPLISDQLEVTFLAETYEACKFHWDFSLVTLQIFPKNIIELFLHKKCN